VNEWAWAWIGVNVRLEEDKGAGVGAGEGAGAADGLGWRKGRRAGASLEMSGMCMAARRPQEGVGR
jgi:hypothetical protein